MVFEKSKSAGYLVNHAARLFGNGLQARIKPLGLATAQFMTLLELWEEDGLTQKLLVERLDVEQATMANTLTRMERDGLIRRKQHPTDGRAQLVFLTKRARSLEEPAKAAAAAQNALALADFSTQEMRRFLDLLTKAIRAMKPL